MPPPGLQTHSFYLQTHAFHLQTRSFHLQHLAFQLQTPSFRLQNGAAPQPSLHGPGFSFFEDSVSNPCFFARFF